MQLQCKIHKDKYSKVEPTFNASESVLVIKNVLNSLFYRRLQEEPKSTRGERGGRSIASINDTTKFNQKTSKLRGHCRQFAAGADSRLVGVEFSALLSCSDMEPTCVTRIAPATASPLARSFSFSPLALPPVVPSRRSSLGLYSSADWQVKFVSESTISF